jgi:hypothetical protein
MTNCSACGLPPLQNQALKQCSRCKSAWYHGNDCQKQHYPVHKKQCRRLAKTSSGDATAAGNLGAAPNTAARSDGHASKTNNKPKGAYKVTLTLRPLDEPCAVHALRFFPAIRRPNCMGPQ